LRLIQIEWVYYDRIPPRINEQIVPYIQMFRFEKVWGRVYNIEQLAVFDIEKFGVTYAEIMANQAEEFGIISQK